MKSNLFNNDLITEWTHSDSGGRSLWVTVRPDVTQKFLQTWNKPVTQPATSHDTADIVQVMLSWVVVNKSVQKLQQVTYLRLQNFSICLCTHTHQNW